MAQNIFDKGLFGVPAPFVLGLGYMLVSGLILNTVLGVTGTALLLGSFGVGALIIVGGFTYGYFREQARNKKIANTPVSPSAGRF